MRTAVDKNLQELLIKSLGSHSPVVEAFRSLRTNIQFTGIQAPTRVIEITSAAPGEGKTTVAANLASVMTLAGARCILVDADLRQPKLARNFGLGGGVGLTNVLMGTTRLEEALLDTGIDGLRLLASGPKPPNPSELLGSEAMSSLIVELRAMGAFVIIDTPPLLPVTDAALLASKVDGTILVVRAGSSQRQAVLRGKQALETVQARILGLVINDLSAKTDQYHYYRDYAGSREEVHGA